MSDQLPNLTAEASPERLRKSSALIEPEITELFEYINSLKADAKMVLDQGIQQVHRAEAAESRLKEVEAEREAKINELRDDLRQSSERHALTRAALRGCEEHNRMLTEDSERLEHWASHSFRISQDVRGWYIADPYFDMVLGDKLHARYESFRGLMDAVNAALLAGKEPQK